MGAGGREKGRTWSHELPFIAQGIEVNGRADWRCVAQFSRQRSTISGEVGERESGRAGPRVSVTRNQDGRKERIV
jgi:hypothetical protein